MSLCPFINGPWDGEWIAISDELAGKDTTAIPDNIHKYTYKSYRYTWLPAINLLIFTGDQISNPDSLLAEHKDTVETGWMYVHGQPEEGAVRAQLKQMLQSR